MTSRRSLLAVSMLGAPLVLASASAPQGEPKPAIPTRPSPLFAVEFRIGPKWDTTKAPGEQLHFADHSANLKRLRDAGSLLLGARYSDKGLVILSAATEVEARAMIDADASVQGGTFVYELHKFGVFYPGCVGKPA